MSVIALLDRLDALEARLDAARRRSEAPGQLSLDLLGGGAAPSAKKGPGGGEQCGDGWISLDKTCHKGQGQAGPAEPPPMEARRSRPKERISFEQPIVGPTGAKLTGYTWQWTLEEVPDKEGELVEKRVSNWEESLPNVETGRNVVHQFEVQVGGEARVVSAESALKLLGFTDPDDKKRFGSLKSTARTVARLRMGLHQLDQVEKSWQADWAAVESTERPEITSGEWEQRDGYRVRTWRMGDAKVDQIHNSLGVWSEQEVVSNLVTEWKGRQMEQRGWDWTGRAERTMQSKLNRERDDLQKRLQRAEKKLQATTRSDSPSSRLDAFQARLDALKRRCSTGYGCGSACISVKKECRSSPAAATSRERLQRLEQLARGEIRPRGIGVPKPEEARAMATELQGQRQEQQAVIKAERKRRQEEAKASGRKPSVKVNLRRAKPGGEFGPDGHWYPGGAWMSEGAFVGAKAEPIGEGQQGGGADESQKGGDRPQRVVQPKRKPRRMRPLEPRGEGLPRPSGLKKIATQNDEEWFNDRGYITYPRPEHSQYRGLGGTAFEAAVIQRLSTNDLRWATSQILRIAKRSPQDHAEMLLRVKDIDADIKRMGGLEAWAENERWTVRRELIGVDDERLRAGRIFLTLAPFLGSTSPAAARLREAFRNPSDEQMERFEWDQRAYKESLPEFPGEEGARVWALNNVFRAVARRRQAAAGSRRDALDSFQARLDALQRKCTTGYGCGSTCISVKKECRSEGKASTSKERLQRLEQLARGEIKPRGLGVPKVAEARALVEEIQARRGQRAQELRAQRSERTEGLIPTDQPFAPDLEARLRRGITQRSIRTGAVNYGGEELAEALLKVARAPGQQGVNARKAVAFMEEAGIMPNVAAVDAIEVKRVTDKQIGTPEIPWNDGRKLAKLVQQMGLVTDERMEWYRQDNTQAGRIFVRKAELVRNPSSLKPSPEEERAKTRLNQHIADLEKQSEAFDRGIQQGWRFEEDRKEALSYYRTNVQYARKTYNSLKEGRLNELKWAAQEILATNTKGLSNNDSGGFYLFGQKAYVARAGDGKGFAAAMKVDAAETDPLRMQSEYSSHLRQYLPERLEAMDKKGADYFLISEGPIAYKGRLSNAEKALSIHIHELGHVVDSFAGVRLRSIPGRYSSSGQNETVLMHELGSERIKSRPPEVMELLHQKRGPSAYALTNDLELFAESFASWVFAPKAFEREHPELYDWVESRVGMARQTMARHGKLAFNESW